jgi:hypothetical protein
MNRVWSLAVLFVLLTACQPPTTDPDQKLRDTIVGRAWTPDPAFPLGAPNPTMIFYVGGRVLIDQFDGSWSYINSVFTIKDPRGDVYTTTSPAFDDTHFVFFYGPDTTTPALVHLTR